MTPTTNSCEVVGIWPFLIPLAVVPLLPQVDGYLGSNGRAGDVLVERDPVAVRARPDQLLEEGWPAARTHDYRRNGTTTLFTALEIATRTLSADKCYQKHTNAEFVDLFGNITKHAIRRGSFHSVDDLEGSMIAYIASWNQRATPFI